MNTTPAAVTPAPHVRRTSPYTLTARLYAAAGDLPEFLDALRAAAGYAGYTDSRYITADRAVCITFRLISDDDTAVQTLTGMLDRSGLDWSRWTITTGLGGHVRQVATYDA